MDKADAPTAAAHYELVAERDLHRSHDALGMTPASRARLGLDLACSQHAFDLARQWAEDSDG